MHFACKVFRKTQTSCSKSHAIHAICINYIQATTGPGGCPLDVFVTPDIEPVFGGIYWPGPDHSMTTSVDDFVGFVDIVKQIRDV